MEPAKEPISRRRNWWRVGPLTFVIAMGTVAVHIQSYWWSQSLTLCDVQARTDEGLVSLLIPLTRLAADKSPAWGFLNYKRGPLVWEAGVAGHTPMRLWMSSLDKVGAEGGMVADFGYWKGGWQSDSRPGPFLVLIVPVWFVGILLLGATLAFTHGFIRFRLRTLLVVTTLFAIGVFVLMLKEEA